MILIAKRGETEAWAEEPFDPETDEVELRLDGEVVAKTRWQSALKFGYWDEP